MATKKTALPSKKPPPPPKTRPGPGRSPYGPQGKVPARAPGERYATLPPPSRPLPRVVAAPTPAVRPRSPVAPVAPAVPPSERPETTVPDDVQTPQPLVEVPEMPTPEPIYDPGPEPLPMQNPFKRGGAVRKFAKGGAVGASRRADGIAQRGKTKGRYI